jgi:cytochrome c oxidase subunit 6a
MLSRNAVRAVARSSRQTRAFGTSQATHNYIAEQKAVEHHAAETTDLWRKISIYVCMPAIAVCVAWTYNAETEHKAHLDHLRHENDGHLPEVPAYEYMNRRGKPFPWGMNSLFFNPHANKDLTGE